MEEIWKKVKENTKYEVSNIGRVRSLFCSRGKRKKPKILKSYCGNHSYKRVNMCENYNVIQEFVHRLVLKAFVGYPKKGQEACHNDGNPLNNNLENLRWGTSKENHNDKITHGTQFFGSSVITSKLKEKQVIDIKRMIKKGELLSDIAKIYNVSSSAISLIKRGKTWGWLHVYPLNDLIEHKIGNEIDCSCNPKVDFDDGLIIHSAMDRREVFEPKKGKQHG